MIEFEQVVSFSKAQCNQCFILKYELPRTIDKSIAEFFKPFGEVKYDINKVNLFKIVTEDNYIVEAKLKSTIIKFGLPRELKNTNIANNYRKELFEICLAEWLSNKFETPIITAKQKKEN